jgi:hypothetical protein
MATTFISAALALRIVTVIPDHSILRQQHVHFPACLCPSNVKPVCVDDRYYTNECFARCKRETVFHPCGQEYDGRENASRKCVNLKLLKPKTGH